MWLSVVITLTSTISFEHVVVETSKKWLNVLHFSDNFSTSANESNINKLKPDACFVNLHEFHYFCRACIFFSVFLSLSHLPYAGSQNWNMSCLRNCSFEWSWTRYTYLHNNGVLNKIYDLNSRFFLLSICNILPGKKERSLCSCSIQCVQSPFFLLFLTQHFGEMRNALRVSSQMDERNWDVYYVRIQEKFTTVWQYTVFIHRWTVTRKLKST